MTLEERVKAVENRLEIVEAGEASGIVTRKKWADDITEHVDMKFSALIKAILGNITQMKTWNDDLAEHYKSHSLDKKERYTPKRKTNYKYTI